MQQSASVTVLYYFSLARYDLDDECLHLLDQIMQEARVPSMEFIVSRMEGTVIYLKRHSLLSEAFSSHRLSPAGTRINIATIPRPFP